MRNTMNILGELVTLLILSRMFSSTSGTTQDQTSTRPNTLYDDADDIQRQLDNEALDRLKYGRPKTIWVFHLPQQFPEVNTESMQRYPNTKLKRAKSRPTLKFKQPLDARIRSWDYADQRNWSTQYPECGGRSQSPIDLPRKGLIKARPGRKLVFYNYNALPDNLTLRDDGRRLMVFGNWKRENRPLIYGGAGHSRRYLFHSLTLHCPSEHTIGGFQYPMESQVIHISAEYSSLADAVEASTRDPLAILGVSNIYTFGSDSQAILEELLNTSTNIGIGDKTLSRLPLSAFSPPFEEYAVYQGSLTAPPCSESVLWMVRARSLTVTRATAKMALSLLAPGGEPRRKLLRQTQPRNDRSVYFFG